MRFKTKSEWARAKANDFRQRAYAMPVERSSNWRRHAGRDSTLGFLYAEAARFDRIAERFAARGQ